MANNEPMTDERLAVIRAMMSLTDLGDPQHAIIGEMVAEIERLTRLTAHHESLQREMHHQLTLDARFISGMYSIVEAVAKSGNAEDFSVRAMYTLNYHVYASDEMRNRARAFIAAHPATEEGE